MAPQPEAAKPDRDPDLLRGLKGHALGKRQVQLQRNWDWRDSQNSIRLRCSPIALARRPWPINRLVFCSRKTEVSKTVSMVSRLMKMAMGLLLGSGTKRWAAHPRDEFCARGMSPIGVWGTIAQQLLRWRDGQLFEVVGRNCRPRDGGGCCEADVGGETSANNTGQSAVTGPSSAPFIIAVQPSLGMGIGPFEEDVLAT